MKNLSRGSLPPPLFDESKQAWDAARSCELVKGVFLGVREGSFFSRFVGELCEKGKDCGATRNADGAVDRVEKSHGKMHGCLIEIREVPIRCK